MTNNRNEQHINHSWVNLPVYAFKLICYLWEAFITLCPFKELLHKLCFPLRTHWSGDNRLQENPWLSLFSPFTPVLDRRLDSERHHCKQECQGSNMSTATSSTAGSICYSFHKKKLTGHYCCPSCPTNSGSCRTGSWLFDGLFWTLMFMCGFWSRKR